MADLYEEVQALKKEVETLKQQQSLSNMYELFRSFLLNSDGIIRIKSGHIQSSDYQPGVRGWKLSPSEFEGNDGTFRGDVSGSTFTGVTITGGTVRTSDTENRVEMAGSDNTLTVYSSDIARLILGTGIAAFYSPMGAFSGSVTGVGSQNIEISADPGEGGGTIDLKADAIILSGTIPTSDPTEAGQIWSDGGTLKISSG